MVDTPEYLSTIATMQRQKEDVLRHTQRWIIAEVGDDFPEIDGNFLVLDFHHNGVSPPDSYMTKEAAAARVLQLMGIKHAIIPQSWPEDVCVGSIIVDSQG